MNSRQQFLIKNILILAACTASWFLMLQPPFPFTGFLADSSEMLSGTGSGAGGESQTWDALIFAKNAQFCFGLTIYSSIFYVYVIFKHIHNSFDIQQ
jgi:hypothetical protein